MPRIPNRTATLAAWIAASPAFVLSGVLLLALLWPASLPVHASLAQLGPAQFGVGFATVAGVWPATALTVVFLLFVVARGLRIPAWTVVAVATVPWVTAELASYVHAWGLDAWAQATSTPPRGARAAAHAALVDAGRAALWLRAWGAWSGAILLTATALALAFCALHHAWRHLSVGGLLLGTVCALPQWVVALAALSGGQLRAGGWLLMPLSLLACLTLCVAGASAGRGPRDLLRLSLTTNAAVAIGLATAALWVYDEAHLQLGVHAHYQASVPEQGLRQLWWASQRLQQAAARLRVHAWLLWMPVVALAAWGLLWIRALGRATAVLAGAALPGLLTLGAASAVPRATQRVMDQHWPEPHLASRALRLPAVRAPEAHVVPQLVLAKNQVGLAQGVRLLAQDDVGFWRSVITAVRLWDPPPPVARATPSRPSMPLLDVAVSAQLRFHQVAPLLRAAQDLRLRRIRFATRDASAWRFATTHVRSPWLSVAPQRAAHGSISLWLQAPQRGAARWQLHVRADGRRAPLRALALGDTAVWPKIDAPPPDAHSWASVRIDPTVSLQSLLRILVELDRQGLHALLPSAPLTIPPRAARPHSVEGRAALARATTSLPSD